MKINIGISDGDIGRSTNRLAELLADEMVLYVKTLAFHWNVRGEHFGPLHALFKGQYEALAEISDQVAERIRTLGRFSAGTMEEFLRKTRLREQPKEVPAAKEMVALLLTDHETVARFLREGIAETASFDVGTSDFLTDLLQRHEQTAWILRSHLEK